jgi:hypothetical protein
MRLPSLRQQTVLLGCFFKHSKQTPMLGEFCAERLWLAEAVTYLDDALVF